MWKKYSINFLLALLILPLKVNAAGGSAIKIEYGGTSMTIELSQCPKILSDNGNLVLQTNSMSLSLSLPCKVTVIGNSGTSVKNVFVQNNNQNPIDIFTIDGKKITTLKDLNIKQELRKGLYIINGKKVLIK